MTIMLKEINSQPVVLKKILDKNHNKIKKLCNEIKKRGIEFVYIAARGTSDHAAVYAKYIMEIYTGIPVAFAAPSVITVYGGKPKLKNALVIGISQSGKAEDVLEVMMHAKEQGALTVSVTNYENSPIAKEGNYHLNCWADEEISVAATKTFTAQMMAMAMITAELSENKNIYEQLKGVPDKIEEFLKNYGIEDKIIKKHKEMDECFVLSRGINYSIALEGALKIQETCYVRAKAYAMSDFYHGPLALLDKKIPVIVIAPEGKTSPDTVEMMKILDNYGIITTAITNDSKVSDMADETIAIPKGLNDFISPFITAAAVQLFACKLSLEKGLNPDSPRNIKKVTITK